jgi:hypothetical protein
LAQSFRRRRLKCKNLRTTLTNTKWWQLYHIYLTWSIAIWVLPSYSNCMSVVNFNINKTNLPPQNIELWKDHDLFSHLEHGKSWILLETDLSLLKWEDLHKFVMSWWHNYICSHVLILAGSECSVNSCTGSVHFPKHRQIW